MTAFVFRQDNRPRNLENDTLNRGHWARVVTTEQLPSDPGGRLLLRGARSTRQCLPFGGPWSRSGKRQSAHVRSSPRQRTLQSKSPHSEHTRRVGGSRVFVSGTAGLTCSEQLPGQWGHGDRTSGDAHRPHHRCTGARTKVPARAHTYWFSEGAVLF